MRKFGDLLTISATHFSQKIWVYFKFYAKSSTGISVVIFGAISLTELSFSALDLPKFTFSYENGKTLSGKRLIGKYDLLWKSEREIDCKA